MAIVGDNSANLLRGTAVGNAIDGRGGDDRIFGRSGIDTIEGGTGDDRISGGDGRDRISGGDGDDVVFGFSAADRNPASASIAATAVGTGFDRPVFATAAPGDPDRLYVVEAHSGRILILDPRTGGVLPAPFLDIPDARIAQGNEQGLLGLAFHPDYQANGRFFVYLTGRFGDIEVRAYRRSADPDRADFASRDDILHIDRDLRAGNHNGGWMGFGPDGMLYIGVGDEGLAGDPTNNAQNAHELWGKMLRLNVDGDGFPADPLRDYAIPPDNPFAGGGGDREVWALGLRNPWRASFDRLTGDLYIGDVGQARREEIDFQPAGSPGGANYGWKVKEGRLVFDASVPGNPSPGPALTDPVVEYGHGPGGGFAVVGGYVHRGESPGMQGRYLFADFVTDQLWSLRIAGARAVDFTNHTDQLQGDRPTGITSFAEDGRGNLYLVGIGGTVWRLDFGAASGDAGDRIDGGAGDDRLFGGAGPDTIRGGVGRDRLAGGAQDDILIGGFGVDRIAGGPGDDRLVGGPGPDLLTGGAGDDAFVFTPTSDADTIADFLDDHDTVRLTGFGLASAAQALGFAREVGDDVVFSFAGGETLTVRDTTLVALADDLLV